MVGYLYLDDCCLQADFFYRSLLIAVDKYAPLQEFTFKANDRPWVTVYFKRLIPQWDTAFAMHRTVLYKKLRNNVDRVRKRLHGQHYLDRIDGLKHDNPAKWWKNLKTICKLNNESDCTFGNVTYCDNVVSNENLPAVLDNCFVCWAACTWRW